MAKRTKWNFDYHGLLHNAYPPHPSSSPPSPPHHHHPPSSPPHPPPSHPTSGVLEGLQAVHHLLQGPVGQTLSAYRFVLLLPPAQGSKILPGLKLFKNYTIVTSNTRL